MCILNCNQGVRGSVPAGFMDIDHKVFSTTILSFLLIQEKQLSVSDKRIIMHK